MVFERVRVVLMFDRYFYSCFLVCFLELERFSSVAVMQRGKFTYSSF